MMAVGGTRDGRERKRTKDKKPIWVDSIGKPNRDAPHQKLDHNVIIDEANLGIHYVFANCPRADYNMTPRRGSPSFRYADQGTRGRLL